MTEMHIDGIYDLSTIWKFAEEVFPYFKEQAEKTLMVSALISQRL